MNIRALAVAVALALPAAAAPVTYSIDTSHSKANFVVRHLMVSNVTGKLGPLTGTVVYDKDDPAKTTVEAEIDVTAISTSDDRRDNHLRSPDFFDVARFPKVTFKSTKVERSGEGLKVTGDLTMHGVTKSVVLDAEAASPEIELKAQGVFKSGSSASTKLNRKEFGISWSKLTDNGGAIAGDDIKVTLDIELNRAGPKAAEPAKPAEGVKANK